MVYTKRLTLFIDLLGFREIVSRSTKDTAFLSDIYKLLNSITSNTISAETFNTIHPEIGPKKFPKGTEELKKSIDEISEHYRKMAIDTKLKSSLKATHFSDSLVLSADYKDTEAIIAMLGLVANLNYRLWNYHSVLTRGGLTLGELIHEESGVLIGPAMVKAYELESKLAEFPRILIDQETADFISGLRHNGEIVRLFKPVGQIFDKDNQEIFAGGVEINLRTSYFYLQNTQYAGMPTIMKRYDRSLKKSLPRLIDMRKQISDPKTIRKYNYIIDEMEDYSKDFPFWDDIKV
jgi:hypothetical protein